MEEVLPDPTVQNSPDIVTGPTIQTRPQYNISEANCEMAVFIWELHEKTFPLEVIPPEQITNPLEPDRDSSTSILDLTESVGSERFIRGQQVNNSAEWQLYLQNGPKTDAEVELHVALKCEKVHSQPTVPILVKTALEIIDENGGALWSSGDVCDTEVKPLSQGNSHVIFLGSKAELQRKKTDLIKNGVLRFRLRLNLYKDLLISNEGGNNCENEKPPCKRRRLESWVTSGLNDLRSSLDGLWNYRQQTGDITIMCGDVEIKAHRVILSGRSQVFMKMLDNKMEEKATSVININDIHPEIITAMLEFLYTGSTSQFDWTNIGYICALIYAADKYSIVSLMTKCYQTLMSETNLENFAQIAKVTFMYDCGKQFKDEVRHFFESNQVTLNAVESFHTFARDDFDHFCTLFFYVS